VAGSTGAVVGLMGAVAVGSTGAGAEALAGSIVVNPPV